MIKYGRRVFIQRLTFMGGGVVLLGSCRRSDTTPPVVGDAGSAHQTLTNRQYTALAAACDRILPRDEDPGALDANVPEYVDRQLKTPELQSVKWILTSGLDLLERRGRARFGKVFSELPPERQDEVLRDFRDSPPQTGEARFYELLITMTLEGFLGDPSYGGNKDYVGWKLVGFNTTPPGAGYNPLQHLHHHGGH